MGRVWKEGSGVLREKVITYCFTLTATGLWLTVPDQFPDYVFESNYNLSPFKDKIRTLRTKKHLDGIPSANEVKEKGYEVGQFNINHLKATEELYLYLDELNQKQDKMAQEIEKLKRENEGLKNKIIKIQK